MKLLIAIPALNEEASISSIIERTLAAREHIIRESPATSVDITVVSDGSTDRTVELAKAYSDEIDLIVFETNRGYGAAIMEAWSRSDAELLSFLDADGTCDPLFFATLCRSLEEESADIALGCRLHAESQMPPIRRFGNRMFSLMLMTLSSKRVRDTASGMRVVRRQSLWKVMPLPDGLHFTPAMSARALLRHDVRVIETDMPYHEREGESKLSVVGDGLRFFYIILQATFLYRPSRPMDILGGLLFLVGAFLMILPVRFYLRFHELEEWMIYRFVVCNLFGVFSMLCLCMAHLGRKIVGITLAVRPEERFYGRLTNAFFKTPWFWCVPFILVLGGGLLVWASFVELATTGTTTEHWSRFIAMSFFLSIAGILLVTRIMDFTLNLIINQTRYMKRHPAEEIAPED